jgi:hypothetical protein
MCVYKSIIIYGVPITEKVILDKYVDTSVITDIPVIL